MTEEPPLPRLIAESTVLVVLVPAALVFMGYTRAVTFYGRLGLPDHAALPSIETLAVEGFELLQYPALALVLLFMVVWALRSVWKRKVAPIPSVKDIPLLPWTVAAAWWAAAVSLAGIGDSSPHLFAGVSRGDAAIIAFAIMLTVILLRGPREKDEILQLMFGKTFSASILLVILLIGGLHTHAMATGSDAGSDVAWGCVDAPGVRFPNGTEYVRANETYVFIAHAGGVYYVRDPSLRGDVPEVIAVPESEAGGAVYERLSARNDC